MAVMAGSVRRYGIAPYTVVLVHGGPGAAGEMAEIAVELSDEFGVLECLQSGRSVGEQVAELYGQIVANTVGPVDLVGYSWGAWLSVILAAEYPESVRRLIMIGAGAFHERYNGDMMRLRLERLEAAQKREAQEILHRGGDMSAEDFMRFGHLMESADAYEHIRDSGSVSAVPDVGIYQSVWPEAQELRRSGGLLDAVRKLRCPVVALHGDYDTHPAKGVGEPLSQILPGFRMVLLARCGHTPWKELYARDIFYLKLREELKNTTYYVA